MYMKLDFSSFGIVDGDDARLLKAFFPNMQFDQRKSYDEYYLKSDEFMADVTINTLCDLSHHFSVEVFNGDTVCVNSK